MVSDTIKLFLLNEITDDNKRYADNSAKQFFIKFYGQTNSQRPPASVEVKDLKFSEIFIKKFPNFSWIPRITFFLILIVERCFEVKNFPMKAQQL